MASISNESGRKCIQFYAADGKRKSVRLGRVSDTDAERWRDKIGQVAMVVELNEPAEPKLVRWLAGLNDKMHGRLAAAGLVSARAGDARSLAGFIDAYIASRPDVKPRTLINMQQVRTWLVKCFGEGYDLRKITEAEAEDFQGFMRKGGLGENTIRRHIGRSRQLFKLAIRRGIYHGINPFDGMAATVRGDKARQFFVTREMADKVLDACPDAEWRLLFALSRYGGLRCPSEHLALKWADVDWERSRVRVPSPKTEHHEGKESRMIPLFPELRPYLLEVFEAAEPGTEFVITRYRDARANLRTQFGRIIGKAGLKPWPKLWHNLRSTRQTELTENFPLHLVCAWIGNSRAIAQEHYLQMTDADFEKAVRNPVLYGADQARTDSHESSIPAENQLCATSCDGLQEGNYPRQDSNL